MTRRQRTKSRFDDETMLSIMALVIGHKKYENINDFLSCEEAQFERLKWRIGGPFTQIELRYKKDSVGKKYAQLVWIGHGVVQPDEDLNLDELSPLK